MKFLYFTDMHIKGVNPGKRKDIFYLSLLRKLEEIGEVIQKENVNFVVIGGDLFDLPKISHQLLSEVAKIMRKWKVKIFVVPGNHDVYGQSVTTLPHTSLGVLASTGVVTILTRDLSPLYLGKRNDPDYPLVAFTGQEYYQEIDTGVNNDYEIEHSVADMNILVAHGMLLERPFHPDIAFTLMKDVQSDADLILSGHYHPDGVDTTYGTTRFVKPRSAGRLEATKHNIDHMPQYVIVDIQKQNGQVSYDCELRDFATVLTGDKIFDYDAAAEQRLYKDQLQQFTSKIRNIDLTQTTDLPSMIREISKQMPEIQYEHVEHALQYLVLSEKTTTDKTLDGFIPDLQDVYIEEVEITNFQSHANTVINLQDAALNAFVGESNNGKSGMLRAIIWCLYNDPKGTDIIKEGEKFVSVSIKFSNKKKLTRRRTNSDTGYYEIEDLLTNQVQRYTKFGNSIPIEVANVHQMPKITVAKDTISLNVAQQLDGPFMLSMSGADKASAIGKLTKTDVADNAILAISKDIKNLQTGVKSIEKDIEALDFTIDKYKYIDDEKELLAKVGVIIDEITMHDNFGKKFYVLRQEFNDILIERRMAELTLNNMPDLKTVAQLIENIDDKNKLLSQYEYLRSALQSNTSEIEQNKAVLNDCRTMDVSVIAELEERTSKLALYKKLKEEHDRVVASIEKGKAYTSTIKIISQEEIDQLDASVVQLNEAIENKKAYEYYQNNLAEAKRRYDQEKECIKKLEQTIEATQAEYKEVLIEVGTCPVCGNTLDEHSHFEL